MTEHVKIFDKADGVHYQMEQSKQFILDAPIGHEIILVDDDSHKAVCIIEKDFVLLKAGSNEPKYLDIYDLMFKYPVIEQIQNKY